MCIRDRDKYGIKRVVYSTYQAVSGSGVKGINDLKNGLAGDDEHLQAYAHPIAGNCLPHIDVFTDNGYTKEEMKMINETHKILGDDDIKVTATTVRVPVLSLIHISSASCKIFSIGLLRYFPRICGITQ